MTLVGDSRIAIQQITGAIQCHKSNLKLLLAEVERLTPSFGDLRFLHFGRAFNQSADHLAQKSKTEKQSWSVNNLTEIENLKTLNSYQEVVYAPPHFEGEVATITCQSNEEERNCNEEQASTDKNGPPPKRKEKPKRKEIPEEARLFSSLSSGKETNGSETILTLQQERFRRIATAQQEELRWRNLNHFLLGNLTELTQEETSECAKEAEYFVLSTNDVLYFVGPLRKRRETRKEQEPRLVIPRTMVADVLQANHEAY
jgi:hypothetical protein